MSKPKIFVSCGQRTEVEKQLAGEICKVIRDDGRFDFFFAEFQKSLHGLNENILDALASATGFVSVMHGRGQVSYGDPNVVALTRASVWIEQEIAIAAFIQRAAKKQFLIATYIEDGVGREGIRELLHLNPTVFKINAEVIADLKDRLVMWQAPQPESKSEDDDGKLDLRYTCRYEVPVGRVVDLTPTLINKALRVKEYACTLEVPGQLLSWNTAFQQAEVPGARPGYRRFRATEKNKQGSPILKGQAVEMFGLGVSIAHLAEPILSEVLRQPIYVTAEMETNSYEFRVPCSEVFRDPVPTV